MAYQMAYTDMFGNEHQDSYWRVVQLNIGVADQIALITFYGYKNQAAREAGMVSVGSKIYAISADEFGTLYQEHVSPSGPNLLVMAYQYAINKHDEVVIDDEGESSNVSFFHGATNV